MDEPDNAEKTIRFGCGATAGAILGALFALQQIWITGEYFAAIAIGTALLFGYLALRYGDRFWEDLGRWLPWI